ncbi:hypothetical protein OG426_51055 [Streptomyces canus]|nr:hypothetical protein OG426_51055 [Streptomyces canus]
MAGAFTSRVFALVDAAGFSRLFPLWGSMRFANNEPMTGPDAVEAA